MKILLIFLLITLPIICFCQSTKYDFKGNISKEVLENYLFRSIEFLGICSEGSSGAAPYLEDNLRLIRNVKPKFIGRAAYAWDCPKDDDEHYKIATENAKRIHEIDPEIILQACVFETTYSSKALEVADRADKGFNAYGVEDVPVPDWVFNAFEQKVEKRNFSYENMLFSNGLHRNFWLPGASVPDITKLETRMWYYYRACRYIDAGYESIHFGQADFTGGLDTDRVYWQQVLDKVRAYGKEHARRNYVLCDSHATAGNAVIEGKLLWDFVGYPLRPVTIFEEPLKAKLEIGHADSIYNTMPGGLHPAGWECDMVPQLYEIDNYFSGIEASTPINVWGTDESCWFANAPENYRNEFLEYATDWIWKNAKNGFLEMPGRRPAQTPLHRPENYMYVCNTKSPTCPIGFNQEETIKEIFSNPKYTDSGNRKYEEKTLESKTIQTSILKEQEIINWDMSNLENKKIIPNKISNINILSQIKSQYDNEQLWLIFRAYGAFSTDEERKEALNLLANINTYGLKIENNALAFNGTEFVEIEDSPEISSTKQSIVMKVKFDPIMFNNDFIMMEKFNFGKDGYYIKYHKPEDKLYIEIFDGNMNPRKLVAFKGVKDGEFHTLIFTADGKKLNSYVDGILCESVACGTIISNNKPLTIGQNINGLEIKNLRIFNKGLTETEIIEMSK